MSLVMGWLVVTERLLPKTGLWITGCKTRHGHSKWRGQGFIYTPYIGPYESVYFFTFEDTPGCALPAPLQTGSPSSPWYDLYIIRHFCSDFRGLKQGRSDGVYMGIPPKSVQVNFYGVK